MVRADEATRFKPGQSGNPNCEPQRLKALHGWLT
jgi:hypothetical protein